MNRIYFDLDDPGPLATWLAARPGGQWHVLIGTDDPEADVTHQFTELAAAKGPVLVGWLVAKLQRGEMVVRVSEKVDLPSGVPLVER